MNSFYGVIAIVIFLLFTGYLIHIIWLWLLISREIEKWYWPRKWLVLAFFPLLGSLIIQRLRKLSGQPIEIDLTEPESINGNFDYRNVGWILFQEQYDRKSGDHQGTSVYLLNAQEYEIVSYSQKNDINEDLILNSEKEIIIPYPGKVLGLSLERFLWASLKWEGDAWKIYNERDYTIIPVYKTVEDETLEEGSVQLCKKQDITPYALKNGNCFIVHTTEFRIFQLPKIALFTVDASGEKKLLAPLSNNTVFVDVNMSIVSKDNTQLLMSIDGCNVVTNTVVIYKSVILMERQLERGIHMLPLLPGDSFFTSDNSVRLVVDFAKDMV